MSDAVLADVVLDCLTELGWTAVRVGDEPFRTTYPGTNGELPVAIHVDDERRFVVVHTMLPVDPAEGRLPVVGELALQLSWRMDIGSVDVDLDGGTVLVRCGADLEGVEATTAVVRNLLTAACVQADRFLPAIAAAAAAGGATAADALQML